MRRSVLTFIWSAFMMSGAVANDHCTNPTEYTVDRRCYVPDALQAQSPYSAVVRLIDSNDGYVYCSGTIVNFRDAQYILTARHCGFDDDNGGETDEINREIVVITPDGNRVTAHYHSDGGQFLNNEYINHDWLFYRIDDVLSPMARPSGVAWRDVSDTENMDLHVIGYGGMKILSDAEIRGFKSKYIQYLRGRGKKFTEENGELFGGVKISTSQGDDFLISMGRDFVQETFFDDNAMKTSLCRIPQSYCQAWGGASGSGYFDSNGNIVGVVSLGVFVVGGKFHAFVDAPAIPTKIPDNLSFDYLQYPSRFLENGRIKE